MPIYGILRHHGKGIRTPFVAPVGLPLKQNILGTLEDDIRAPWDSRTYLGVSFG